MYIIANVIPNWKIQKTEILLAKSARDMVYYIVILQYYQDYKHQKNFQYALAYIV